MAITPHSTFTLHRPENVSPYAASMQIQPNKTHWIRRPCSFTICVRLVSRAATEPHRADSMSASSHRPHIWLQACKPASLISRSRRHLRPERLTYRECIRNVRFRPDWDGDPYAGRGRALRWPMVGLWRAAAGSGVPLSPPLVGFDDLLSRGTSDKHRPAPSARGSPLRRGRPHRPRQQEGSRSQPGP
jgi:hypothetical protein